MTIKKRTFEALKYPKGSPERTKLNESGVSSEYMPSYKWQLEHNNFSACYRTKAEAERAFYSLIRSD